MALQRDDLKAVRQRQYVARDFDALRANLLEYARAYYPDRLRDFSESSLGGMLLDLAACVGDNLSFYLDHQYGELHYDTVVETVNVQRALDRAGVPVVGAAAALCSVTVYVEVPAITAGGVLQPMPDALPVIKSNSSFTANNGTVFNLVEDIDFTSTRTDGTFWAEVKLNQQNSSFVMALSGLCVSGVETTENVSVGATFVPFNRVTLQNADVTEIISVTDLLGNTYYQVGALTHDVVFRNVVNLTSDSDLVPDAIKLVPAPYRYTTNTDLTSRKTTLTFGGGNADSLEDDSIPDPSTFAVSFPYTKTFSRISVNPQQLLSTTTLGVAAANTTYAVTYRYGGGLSHNVDANTVQTPRVLNVFFPGNPQPAVAAAVKGSIEATNRLQASGGEDAPSVDDLKALIPAVKNSQERVVTRSDLLARVYTLPANFGRVFRASVRSNPNNPLATQLYIVSRDSNDKLITSPDTLKRNLVRYLNPYRMISDAIDVLDARVINLTFTFDVLIDPSLNRSIVLQNALTRLQKYFKVGNFHIDQPIVLSDLSSVVFQVPGIVSINQLRFDSITGKVGNRTYSDETFDVGSNTRVGLVVPPPGGIFEVRYPATDVVGRASV